MTTHADIGSIATIGLVVFAVMLVWKLIAQGRRGGA